MKNKSNAEVLDSLKFVRQLNSHVNQLVSCKICILIFYTNLFLFNTRKPIGLQCSFNRNLDNFNAIQPLRECNLEQIKIAIDSTKSAACRNVNPMYYNNCMRIQLLWKSLSSFHADRSICLLRDYRFVFIANCNWYCQILFSRIQPNRLVFSTKY